MREKIICFPLRAKTDARRRWRDEKRRDGKPIKRGIRRSTGNLYRILCSPQLVYRDVKALIIIVFKVSTGNTRLLVVPRGDNLETSKISLLELLHSRNIALLIPKIFNYPSTVIISYIRHEEYDVFEYFCLYTISG